ncbi:uncharacterized protein LOC135688572 [Rhopilema esculentum]|uniref:uncharacterized protein LOC135688572 n=1 Tax=Rhopilema esculentum TaxID=499914 RepID=UPI0031CE4AD3
MTVPMTGKLATLDDFIKGKTKLFGLSDKSAKGSSAVHIETESADDPEKEMKTFWFSNSQEDGRENAWLPGLSKKQRIVGFFTLLVMGIFCFGMAGLLMPFMVLKARKFVLMYTMGSFFTIGSFSVLWGPVAHMKHLCSYTRLPFTLAYFGTMFATLYSALLLKKTLLTLIFATLQIVALAWYVFSYVPGGTTGMKFFSKLCAQMCAKTISKTLPV